jgi:hypothetical protein
MHFNKLKDLVLSVMIRYLSRRRKKTRLFPIGAGVAFHIYILGHSRES